MSGNQIAPYHLHVTSLARWNPVKEQARDRSQRQRRLVTGNSDFACVSSEPRRHCPPHSFLSQGGPAIWCGGVSHDSRDHNEIHSQSFRFCLALWCLTKKCLTDQIALDATRVRSTTNARERFDGTLRPFSRHAINASAYCQRLFAVARAMPKRQQICFQGIPRT